MTEAYLKVIGLDVWHKHSLVQETHGVLKDWEKRRLKHLRSLPTAQTTSTNSPSTWKCSTATTGRTKKKLEMSILKAVFSRLEWMQWKGSFEIYVRSSMLKVFVVITKLWEWMAPGLVWYSTNLASRTSSTSRSWWRKLRRLYLGLPTSTRNESKSTRNSKRMDRPSGNGYGGQMQRPPSPSWPRLSRWSAEYWCLPTRTGKCSLTLMRWSSQLLTGLRKAYKRASFFQRIDKDVSLDMADAFLEKCKNAHLSNGKVEQALATTVAVLIHPKSWAPYCGEQAEADKTRGPSQALNWSV